MTIYKTNLLVPGAGKSGTTSLHAYLNQHPQICMMQVKEPHYFSIEVQYIRGPSYYNSLYNYSKKNNPLYFGESSTTYLLSETAIERIKKHLDNPRFIIVLRNPIDRIYSHYKWLSTQMDEERSIKEAVLANTEPLYPKKSQDVYPTFEPWQGVYRNYLFESCYGTCLEKYIKTFGPENIHIITTEKLRDNYVDVLNGCFDFLGLPHLDNITLTKEGISSEIKINSTPSFLKKMSFLLPNPVFRKIKNKIIDKLYIKYQAFPLITPEQRLWLKGMLEDEVKKLRQLTKKDFSEWNDFN